MVHKRSLPEAHNPLIEPEHTPQLEILVERRRLGQTDLAVKPGQVGLTNATKVENLGIFDYAHLRVPLPKDLKGSGIFSLQKNGTYPESYFLMRRSSDGYISATGMFKAAFPWASTEEEAAERKHHKTIASAGHEEVAGNVWISPEDALTLADEYGMRPWIVALLDPEPIEKGMKDKDKHDIATPPKFDVPKDLMLPAQGHTSMRTRNRELRSSSPTKIATPSRKIASPRKSRATRSSNKADGTSSASALRSISIDKRLGLVNGTEGSLEPESVNGDLVTVEVDETVEKDKDTEIVHTTVKVEVPHNHPDVTLPESAEDMVAQARRMVEEANKLEGNRVNGVKALKRKADELEEDDDEVSLEAQPVKKARVLEEELKKERVKSKALIGLSVTIAIGALLPYFV